MNVQPALHPTDKTLSSYGLGKLDDASAEAVNKHLEECPDCRKRVAEMPADSFLGRVREAQGAGKSMLGQSQGGRTRSLKGANAPAPLSADTLPPGLAEHPDYQVLRELGRGGMGVVYLAENKLMGRKEALKVVSSHLLNRKGVLERFLREIRSAAQLDHRNIVTAYSASRVGESLVLSMEYVEGYDLSQLVKPNRPLPVAEACNFVYQAALGLQHAHQHGMVHRDIKPSNLMLAREGHKPVIKVLDFGLAKVTSEGLVEGSLTHEGQMLGTPDFIAPEQIRDAQSAGIRADIYSLGCTLYFLLTGGAPFQGSCLYDILQAHHSMDAKPLNLIRPEVPVELAALVAKMMAKEPERRFQTPAEVAEALKPFLRKDGVVSKALKPEMSQVGLVAPEQGPAKVRTSATQPELKANANPASGRSAAGSRTEPRWESLIKIKDTEDSEDAVAVVSQPKRRWPRYGKLLDYEQFIDHQLARTLTHIKITEIVTAAFILLVGFVGTMLAEVVLDHAFGLPLIVRRVILVVGMTAAFAFTLLRVVLPLVLRINSVSAAFKNSLVNYLTLRAHRDRLPEAVLATLEARAVSDLAHVEVEQAVNQQHLMKAFYTLCGVAVVFIFYAAIQPKSILDSTKRAFLADVVRPTNTRLIAIKPGDDAVVAGMRLIFSVDTNSGVRPETVKLHYSVDGGKFYAIKEFEPGTHHYDPWQFTFNNVQQTMDYYVTGGDAESLHYTLTVLPAPTVTSVKIDYDFPKYTQVPPRSDIEDGNVEAIEDTTVTVHATTNYPTRGGSLNLTTGDPAPMPVAADDPYKLTGQFKVTKSGTYTINFRTTSGQLNPNPVVYDIHAIADRPPQATFLWPDRPTVWLPANVKVDLIMTVWDDHGIKDATLHVSQENESLISKNVLEGRPTAPEFWATEVIDLAQLRVKPGQTLRYWLTARDNHEPASHIVQTAAQFIEITDAVAPAEKQKIEETEAKDRQQFEQPPPAETEGKNDAEKGGAGNDRQPVQDRGTQDKSRDPDQGAASSETAGQNNPAGGQQPPAFNRKLRKYTEGLQKKGLLNPNAELEKGSGTLLHL